jgi:single-strand DNA-binding protein
MFNMVVLIGKMPKPPQVRDLRSGISLASFDLHVPRTDQQVDNVPVTLFDASDQDLDFRPGQDLLALGRVRRRFFRLAGDPHSRTEVVADRVILLEQRDEACEALQSAGTALAQVLADMRATGP